MRKMTMKEYSQTQTVTNELTAAQLGSGLLPVYATPAVVALMENTACGLIASLKDEDGALKEGETTVGTRIAVDHIKACLPGEEVIATAHLININGRQYDFAIEVRNHEGEILAKAEHTRFLVIAERFMQKLNKTL